MKLCTGLRPPTQGTVVVDGREVAGPLKIVGMAFQAPNLLPWRTTLDNVLLPLEIVEPYRASFKRKRAEYVDKARAILKTVGLQGNEDKFPWQLSGGMQQRASICRALIHEPKLLMLDEPFGALDAFTREELWCVLRDLWQEQRFTVVLVTHDLREAVFLADTVYCMSKRPGPHHRRARRSSCRGRATSRSPTRTSSPRSCTSCASTSAPCARPDGGRRWRGSATWIAWAPWLFLAGILVLWEGICRLFNVSEFILPTPSASVMALFQYFGPIAGHAWQTFWTTMVGFGIGDRRRRACSARRSARRGSCTTACTRCWSVSTRSRRRRSCRSWWSGSASARARDPHRVPDLLLPDHSSTSRPASRRSSPSSRTCCGRSARSGSRCCGRWACRGRCRYFFASLKVAITLAFVGAVVSEITASNEGIGYLMMAAGSSMRMPLVFAGLIVISVMAMAMYELFALLERRMTGWATRGMNQGT